MANTQGMTAEPGGLLETVIEARRGWTELNLKEVWEYRGLLYFLVWRDVKVRYKQTALGATWAILQPALTTVVFTLSFGKLAKMPSDGVPYALFVFCAQVPWQLFSHALTDSSTSLVGNQGLITKVYFPRLVIPTSAVLAGLVDFAIAFVVLLGMMAFYGATPTARMLLVPVLVVFALLTALAVGLWLSALNVKYRDVRYTIPFLTQFWMFATPIAYPASLIPQEYRALYGLNPMAGVVEGFRWAMLGTQANVGGVILVSVAAVVVLLAGGLIFFRRMEATFADLV